MPFLAPLVPVVTAFAGSWVGQAVIGVAVSFGVSMLRDMLNKSNEPKQKPMGFRLSLAMGDTEPCSFEAGYSGAGGTRKYAMSWGNSGEVPNAYLTEVIQVGDLTIPNTAWGVFANKQRVTFGDTPTDKGYPVLEFREGGVDHMWMQFRTGAETTASAFLIDKFGSHSEYPWKATMIGRGAPHAIVTTLVNRELFLGAPSFIFEPPSPLFYDLRNDSTNGGDGLERWDDPTTWTGSGRHNPVIMMYNIIRGIRSYNDVWFYGGHNLPAFRLPAASWIAAANECDAEIELEGGGTEPQFRFGAHIAVDIEPLAMLEILKRSCNARLSEIGGIFEILVGAPGAAVYAFDDDDIVISRNQTYNSFPGLNATHNAIAATYPEPAELWAMKAAPTRYNAAYEAEDGGRRLATGITLETVPYALQAQRIMRTLVDDDRRWRTHYITLPPDAWVLTGTCVVSWTSEKNGYVNKKFLVHRAEGEPGMLQPVILKEIDPSDYDWNSSEELPTSIGELVIVRPAPQPFSGLQVFGATIYDDDGDPRRPTIRVQYDGGMPDIQFVHVLVRLKSSGDYVFEQYIPFAVPYVTDLNGVFLPNTEYEVAARYVPYTGRPTEFSAYQTVLTPDVKLIAGKDFDPYSGVTGFEQLADDLSGYQSWMGSNVRELIEQAQAQATLTAGQELANAGQFDEIRRTIGVAVNDLAATFTEVITVTLIPLGAEVEALADALTTVTAGDGSDVSTARFRMTAMSGPTGYSRVGVETRVHTADPDDWRGAGTYWDTPNNPADPTRILNRADQFILVSADLAYEEAPFVFEDGEAKMTAARIETIRSGLIESEDSLSFWNLNTGAFRIST